MSKKLQLSWNVGYSKSIESKPEIVVPATVPGAVQLDWAKAHSWPSHCFGENYKMYSWMEDVYWTYSANISAPPLSQGEKLFFVCKGIDYSYSVKLNGETLYEWEGMFTAYKIDLSEKLNETNLLEITILPAPKREGAEIGRSQADQSCKLPCSYGWDWHPRLIPLGIWEEAYVEKCNEMHICEAELSYSLDEKLENAEIHIGIMLSKLRAAIVKWRLRDKDGICVNEQELAVNADFVLLESVLKNPMLWWPNGHGEAVLYTSTVELYSLDGDLLDFNESKVGFRTVALVMYDGAWEEELPFPRPCNEPPITLEVNGRKIFAKGSNWLCPDIFPGVVSDETNWTLVELAKNANMNLLRIWGGAISNKDSFFEACNEMGIMIWQEFPLACNNYIGTEQYLEVLDAESKSIIKRLRQHPSIAMWCGGNELFNSWSGMTEQSLALRLLNRNCYDLDPSRPFLMTSPIMGMAHGSYVFRYENGEDVFQVMPKVRYTAYTEFGCAGPSPLEYLKTFIPKDELFPPKPGGSWEVHHAFNAWNNIHTWLDIPTIEYYFGSADTLDELVQHGELMQSEGYKCIYEESRRQKPRCSMALNWCFNEPWPTAAGNSLINWPNLAKPAYYAVAKSCRPFLASARIAKFKWAEGDIFDPELWILNDSYNKLPGGVMKVLLGTGGNRQEIFEWKYPVISANANLRGPTIRFILPKLNSRIMTLILMIENCPEMDSEYTLLISGSEDICPTAGSGLF